MTTISSFLEDLRNKSFLRSCNKTVREIEHKQNMYEGFEAADFAAKTNEFKRRIADGESADAILPEAFALVRCAAEFLRGTPISVLGQSQVWDMTHYKVQLVAGIALWKNMIAEVATGEGKTLIATLPAYMNAIYGRGCHIATVNEYLARRDSEWMGYLYSLLGLTCGCVYSNQNLDEKKKAYASDITYGTSSEFGFDYLRDNSMVFSPDEKVQRGFFYCLVDEADSILIDEARTPLIISGEADIDESDGFASLLPSVRAIVQEQNKLCNKLANEVLIKIKSGDAADEADLKKLFQVKCGTPRNKILKQILNMGVVNIAFEKLQTSLSAGFSRKDLYDLHEELFYYIEERNRQSTLTLKGQAFLSPRNPDAFTIPDTQAQTEIIENDKTLTPYERTSKISALRGAAFEISRKIHEISQLLTAFSLFERDIDYIVRDSKIEIIDPNTGRVMSGRRWSDGLHQAVEAKEGVKVEKEDITYATVSIQNYFRMYKKLSGMTGTAKELSQEFADVYGMRVVTIPTNKPSVRKDDADVILLTRREKYLEIIRRVEAAANGGRPVLVGTASVEDSEVLSRMLKIKKIGHRVLNAKNDAVEAAIVAGAGAKSQITIATNMAGRGTDIKLGDGVNELGGLLIIAAEHHNSARVDRQLMGRCARQGDNGETIFVVSLEDDLLRIHANLAPFQKVMKSRHQDGLAFEHPLFSRIIEKAQEHVEGDYSTARKEMLKFDNPANRQRGIVYAMRDSIIGTAARDELFKQYLRELVNAYVYDILPELDLEIAGEHIELLRARLTAIIPLDLKWESFVGMKKTQIEEMIFNNAAGIFDTAFAQLPKEITDSIKTGAMLSSLDSSWREHISRLEELREGIYLRSYAQKDPYCEFEKEAFESFKDFFNDFRNTLFKGLSMRLEDISKMSAPSRRETAKAVIR